MTQRHAEGIELEKRLVDAGHDITAIEAAFWTREVETAGWCFTATGSRFHIHASPGAARNTREKVADGATVHRLTGVAPEMAINTLVDLVELPAAELAGTMAAAGIRVGSLCPNLSRNDRYRFGSLTNVEPAIRGAAVDDVTRCLVDAGTLGATALSLWVPDGLHYPGQDDIWRRHADLTDSLRAIAGRVPAGMQFLLEYKLYEPAPYYTDIPDWGTALTLCEAVGPDAAVLVDFGHHAQGVNIPAILTLLAHKGRLGALHLNDRLNADDDLTVGSVNPYMIFLAMDAIAAGPNPSTVRFGLDQHHTAKVPLLATVRSIMNIQLVWLKALLVDRAWLSQAQLEHRTDDAEEHLQDVFSRDLRPLVALWRDRRGLPADPAAELSSSGLLARNETERG